MFLAYDCVPLSVRACGHILFQFCLVSQQKKQRFVNGDTNELVAGSQVLVDFNSHGSHNINSSLNLVV